MAAMKYLKYLRFVCHRQALVHAFVVSVCSSCFFLERVCIGPT